MRVISQDGADDFLYVNLVFYVTDDGKIKVTEEPVFKLDDESCKMIAKYSSKEKAMKAMEILRERYLEFANSTNMKDVYEFLNNQKTFRFPPDDEVST